MKCKERELDLELPDYMTKGGPGDNSAPGQLIHLRGLKIS